ncbi:MAG: hypothetical protein NC191_05685 [Muribaculaceae bacterium]|nr:hypothetical protein [Muribaculaceae bacterium]
MRRCEAASLFQDLIQHLQFFANICNSHSEGGARKNPADRDLFKSWIASVAGSLAMTNLGHLRL